MQLALEPTPSSSPGDEPLDQSSASGLEPAEGLPDAPGLLPSQDPAAAISEGAEQPEKQPPSPLETKKGRKKARQAAERLAKAARLARFGLAAAGLSAGQEVIQSVIDDLIMLGSSSRGATAVPPASDDEPATSKQDSSGMTTTSAVPPRGAQKRAQTAAMELARAAKLVSSRLPAASIEAMEKVIQDLMEWASTFDAPASEVPAQGIEPTRPNQDSSSSSSTGGEGLQDPAASGTDSPAVEGSSSPAVDGSDLPAASSSERSAVGGSDRPAERGPDSPAANGSAGPAANHPGDDQEPALSSSAWDATAKASTSGRGSIAGSGKHGSSKKSKQAAAGDGLQDPADSPAANRLKGNAGTSAQQLSTGRHSRSLHFWQGVCCWFWQEWVQQEVQAGCRCSKGGSII